MIISNYRSLINRFLCSSMSLTAMDSKIRLLNETEVFQVDPNSIAFPQISSINHLEGVPTFADTATEKLLQRIAGVLKTGDQVVAIPTETVYGLAGNAFSTNAVTSIFHAKQRPSDNPLIVHVASLEMLRLLLPTQTIPPFHLSLIKRFWPGPLTLLFPVAPNVLPTCVTAGLSTVAVRFPSNLIARALIRLSGVPFAMPSANSSGKPSPTMASHVVSDLNGRIPYVIDGGQCEHGLESTVLALTPSPTILRPGGITLEQLQCVPGLEEVHIHGGYTDQNCAPISPGMKYRHYSPRAPVYLLLNPSPSAVISISKQLLASSSPQSCIGWFVAKPCNWGTQMTADFNQLLVLFDGRKDPARELFRALRWFDEKNAIAIIVDAVPEQGIGHAYMNRIRKAATYIIK